MNIGRLSGSGSRAAVDLNDTPPEPWREKWAGGTVAVVLWMPGVEKSRGL